MKRTHCPFCGKPNRAMAGELHRKCASCGMVDWVNPAPAIGVALLRGGKVLLSRRAFPPKQDEWDLVGGFIDRDEAPWEAARREVREETGCTVRGMTVSACVPGEYDGRPTLNFLATGRITGVPKASDDSAELRWWPLDDLPPLAWPHEAKFLRQLRT